MGSQVAGPGHQRVAAAAEASEETDRLITFQSFGDGEYLKFGIWDSVEGLYEDGIILRFSCGTCCVIEDLPRPCLEKSDMRMGMEMKRVVK